jgi:asparagine synthase (glutamine-hydrolysing)
VLSLNLQKGITDSPWQLSALTFHCSAGTIEVLDHRAIIANAFCDGAKLGLQVLEQPYSQWRKHAVVTLTSTSNKSDWEQLHTQTKSWPLHWFWVESDGHSLVIESSQHPTVPLYLTATGTHIRANWDPRRMLATLRAKLNWEVAAWYLSTFEQPYASNTVLSDLHHLAAGYVARVSLEACRDDWHFTPPPSTPADYPRALTLKADPPATFELLLNAVTERILGTAPYVAAGLSGGLDSSLVCGLLSRSGREVGSYGLLVHGKERDEQILRRNDVVGRFALHDNPIPIGEEYSPWSDDGARLPWEELYYSPFETLYHHAHQSGYQYFCSGLGGNDLLTAYWNEMADAGEAERRMLAGERSIPDFLTTAVRRGHAERAAALNESLPRAYVQRGVLDSASGMAAQCLRHGLWPVHPLIAPEVVRYAHALPSEWREERRLMRELLVRWRLSPRVTHPQSTESFEQTCANAMLRCPNFQRLLRAERLADAGLVEPGKIGSAFHQWRAARLPSSEALPLVAIAFLEHMLMSVDTVPTSPPANLVGHRSVGSWSGYGPIS